MRRNYFLKKKSGRRLKKIGSYCSALFNIIANVGTRINNVGTRVHGLVLFALDLEDGEKRGKTMVSRVKSHGPASPFPEVHFPEGEMEKR